MRTYEEYRQILVLWEDGFKKKRISIMTGINRATVRDCVNRYHSVRGLQEYRAAHPVAPDTLRILQIRLFTDNHSLFKAYAYLLGLYLGDGHISKSRNTYRLRVACDNHYPGIIESCMDAIKVLLPRNSVDTVKQEGCVAVSCYSNHWPDFFPQHGEGRKHDRPIILKDWQDSIVQTYPLSFFKGLYHSDGCRSKNVVNGKNYPRYQFNNKSDDIRALFSRTCDQLGLHWGTATNGLCIQVARRPDVEFLDRHIGPKS